MHPWAKISSKIAESEQFADAANADLLAGVLFAMMLPQTDLYGIIPGNLRLFIGKVCPLLDQPENAIDAALTILHGRGLIVRYEADGKQWVWLPKWNLHQDVRWTRTGPPDYPLPEGWTPPEELVQACNNDAACSRPLTRWFRRIFQDNPADSGSIREYPGVSGTLPPRLDTESDTESDNNLAPPAGAADAEDVFALAPPPEPEPKGTRAKTDRDHAYEACLAACGVEPASLDKSAWAKYAKAMNAVVKAHSLEEVTAWAEHAAADGGRVLGTGAAPEIKVPALVRRELTADTWAGTFAAARTKAKHNGQRFIEHSVNGRIYERDWTDDMHGTVALYTSQGLWDDERGMTTIDPRHPSRQQPVAGA